MNNSKKYWNSLEQLNGDTAFVEASQKEFSEQVPVDEFIGKQTPQKTFIYRTHDEPDDQKLAGLQRIVSQFGHQLNWRNTEFKLP